MKKFILSILVVFLIPSPLLAISPNDSNSISYDTIFYEKGDLSGQQCIGGGASELDGHKLPAAKGGTGLEESINEAGQVPSTGGKVTFNQFASLGQEYRDYYITMRWRYVKWNWNGTSIPGPENVSWYSEKPRKVLVTNPRTKKSIVAAILEAGPAPWTGTAEGAGSPPPYWEQPQDGTPKEYKGRVSGFPPKAFQALGATMRMADGSGDDLLYSWATNQDAKPGPVSTPGNISEASDCDEIADANILQHKPRLSTNGKIRPTGIVLHWWAFNAAEGRGINALVDGLRGNRDCGSAGCSVQLGILKDGKTYQLTNSLTSRALHATCSNDSAIGIEIEGTPSDFGSQGPSKRPEQFAAVVATTKYLMEKYDIPLEGKYENGKFIGVFSHKQVDRKCQTGNKIDVDDEYLQKVKDQLRTQS